MTIQHILVVRVKYPGIEHYGDVDIDRHTKFERSIAKAVNEIGLIGDEDACSWFVGAWNGDVYEHRYAVLGPLTAKQQRALLRAVNGDVRGWGSSPYARIDTVQNESFDDPLTDEQSAALSEMLVVGESYGSRQLDAFEQAIKAGKSIDDAKLAFRNAGPEFDA